ncbi:MAG TPA: selenide, water dikinase SelD [Thermoanaerobaculia bacterium]|nr:selenide, water dikinase SelD [Thermoanaerobaculia bacterium]
MGQADLAKLLSALPRVPDPRALVGYETADDAAVFRLGAEGDPAATLLLATVDFFTPVVESPFDFGRVAAANALSDVWAMGGEPLFALALAGFPTKKLPLEVLGEVFRGGAEVAREAGIPILGGHTTDFDVPVYGLSVTGSVAASRLRRNVGARAGDALVLTKAIGTGILTSALRARVLSEKRAFGFGGKGPEVTGSEEQALVDSMVRLNRHAARAADGFDVAASTDVTGYGLLGHLAEMLAGGGLGAEISAGAVPILPGARRLVEEGIAPDGTRRNRESIRAKLRAADVDDATLLLLADAQTSGGLLVAVAEGDAEALVAEVRRRGDESAARIGRFTENPAGEIHISA